MLINFRKLPEFFQGAYKLEDRFRPNVHVPFIVNSAQRDLLELCAQIQDQRQLVWLIAIKPRRVGLSRVISGIGTSIAFHQPGTAGVVMAQLGSTLGKIMTSYSIMSRGLPTKVKIDYVSAGKGGREISTISIGKGKRPSSIVGSKALATGEGRGDAAQFMQLTEAAHYPPQSPFTAMLPSVPRSLDTFVGIESTPSPDRRGIAFREMWEQARWITDTRRDALFVRYFCPWMKDPYAFADPKIARDAPLDDDERALMAVGVDRAQIAWRRMEIRGRYRGKKELFEQENPSDPMCLAANTLCSTEKGIIPLVSVEDGAMTESGKAILLPQGKAPVFQLRTKYGRTLVGTGHHRLETADGRFVKLEDSFGEQLRLRAPRFAEEEHTVSAKLPAGANITIPITSDLARFLGYFVSDGSYYGGMVSVVADNQDRDIVADIERLFDKLFGTHQTRFTDGGSCCEIRVGSVAFKSILRALGLWANDTPHRKVCVPPGIFQSPESIVREFVQSVFEGDGNCSKYNRRISMGSSKLAFLQQMQQLLLGLKLPAQITYEPKKGLKTYPCWSLKLYSLASQRYAKEIGFLSARKQAIADTYSFPPKSGRAPEPINWTDTVRSVEPFGEAEVYDLSIDSEEHTFSANGIVVHNSCFMQTETPAFSPEERAYAKSTEETPPKVGTGMFEGSGKSRGDFPIRIKLGSDNPWWRFYEEPQKRCEYYIGVDAARGFDGFRGGDENRITDFAAIVVINGSTNAVAAVLEARIPPDHVARQVALAGKFYRTREISEYHYALINIAITDGFGSEVLRRVRDDYDYPIHRFLRWRGRDDRIHNRPGQNIGWIDTEATNALRVNTFRIALGNEQFVCRDSKLIEQIHSSSMTGYGDAEVVRGHDDVLDATMYAWIARDMERPREIIDFNASETTTHRMMIKLANDPQATFNQLWGQIGKMARPERPNRVEEMVEHINGNNGVFV